MAIKAQFIRGVKTNQGSLRVYSDSPDVKLDITLPARSGVGGSFNNTSWKTGKSPIPRSSEVAGGKLYIWIDPTAVKQPGQIPKDAKGIGEFWPISNSKTQSRYIYSAVGNFLRDAIGAHLDNTRVWDRLTRKVKELFGFAGSSGCIVIEANSEKVFTSLLEIRAAFFTAAKSGQKHIELVVI